MPEINKGGHRYCPECREIVETRVLMGGHSQVLIKGVPAKRRLVRHTNSDGEGCGHEWYTFEIAEDWVEVDQK